MVKILHYVVLGVILLGAVYYIWIKPPTINPMIDRRSADALAMVQTIGRWAIPPFCRR